ncbi:TVG0246963 [Thermoplasma volcanium GSS1]|uniref:TVG0246963 protein n=1 Tax=Thermoplasma volcanium (strain ATCC 51530 / DSM 4299 / JCM 9571 / NBRC 15438 / GSS1) TaxID=273116 RepID=Q97C67_THEVO|nr:hypothetical protein [Thermoplasma volcanium]BAB59379.1 TVG0246963 [Thermoplasma volcanium GSS1]
MVSIVVEHRWKEKNQDAAFKVVGSIIDMQKNGTLPAGFTLKSVNVIGSERMAVCEWDAPSLDDFKALLEKVNPPTKHEVFEAQRLL